MWRAGRVRYWGGSLALVAGAMACSVSGLTGGSASSGDAFDASDDAPARGNDGSFADASDGGARWCARGTHTFCDDFDEGELGAGWEGSPASSSTLAFESAKRVSAPRSLRVLCGPNSAPCHLEKLFARKESVRIEMDVLRVTQGTDEYPIWTIKTTGAEEESVFLGSQPDRTVLHICSGSSCTTPAYASLPSDRFVHLRTEIEFGSKGGVGHYINEMHAGTTAAGPRKAFTGFTFSVGGGPVSGTTSELLIDNVAIHVYTWGEGQ